MLVGWIAAGWLSCCTVAASQESPPDSPDSPDAVFRDCDAALARSNDRDLAATRKRCEGEELQVKGWPTLFLLDAKGTIRRKWMGGPDEAVLDREIDSLVAEARRDVETTRGDER